jgi:hypothetical protein
VTVRTPRCGIGTGTVSAMLCGLALALVCGLALAAPSLAGDHPPPTTTGVLASPRQADWKLVAKGYPSGEVSADRIYYARVPTQTAVWKWRMPRVHASLRQDFSRYGFLAVFLKPRLGPIIDNIYPFADGRLNLNIHSFPAPAFPSCELPCDPRPPPPQEAPVFLLISIRKDSLPAPVKRLYINEAVYAESADVLRGPRALRLSTGQR